MFCVLGDVLSTVWILLALQSKFRYADLLKAADPALFPLPRLLKPGFAFLNYLPKNAEKGIQRLSGRQGEARMDAFAAYCAGAFAFGAGVPVLAVGAFLAAILEEAVLFGVGVILAGLLSFWPVYRFRDRQKERKAEIERDLPAVISKTVLLNDAGLTLSDAWNTVAVSSDGAVYREMRQTSEQMKNGMSAEEALLLFADRCGVRDARQFAGILSRQKAKGGDDISAALRFLNGESWEGRKQRAKVRGQAASEAMLLPMLMMFIGILLMILLPMLSGMNL